jgi:hypothetical protein
MSIPVPLLQLVNSDALREIKGLGKPAFIHNDHRWVLAILSWAQTQGIITRPSLLVMFDYHTDFAPPIVTTSDGGPQLVEFYNANPSVEAAFAVCQNDLADDDGDWVSGGMELGIISDAVVFGAESGHLADDDDGYIYTDLLNRTHRFWSLPLPFDALAHQGVLEDTHYKPRELWESLGWDPYDGLCDRTQSLILDFDLDVFAMHHRLGPRFAWPDKIFAYQFHERTTGRTDLTGFDFVNLLIDRCGLVTIAREPDYCGGEDECSTILDRLNRTLFAGLAVIS